jgi:NhaP-type Na+/H+ or K+/H+ antiporter
MIYLAFGYLLGPGGMGLIDPDPLKHAGNLQLMSEVAVLISLFAVGLRLGVPIYDRRWLLPLRLAFPSMAVTVGLIALVGIWGLDLPLGAAVLLGAFSRRPIRCWPPGSVGTGCPARPGTLQPGR